MIDRYRDGRTIQPGIDRVLRLDDVEELDVQLVAEAATLRLLEDRTPRTIARAAEQVIERELAEAGGEAPMTVITVGLLALFAWAVRELHVALADVTAVPRIQVDPQQFAAHQLAGLALFGIFFIGAVLGVLLNHAAVRGDAEQGLLQQVVARPIGRTVLLVTRFVVVGTICAAYAVAAYAVAAGSLVLLGAWDQVSVVLPAIWLGIAVYAVCAVTVVVSIFLPASATGILVFMLVGAGLGAGFVLELTATLGSDALDGVAGAATWLLPFERCYQAAVDAAAPATGGTGGALLSLGPLAGGREAGSLLLPWLAGWFVVVVGSGCVMFGRRDL